MDSEKYLLSAGSNGHIMIHGIDDLETYESLNCHPSDIIDFDVHPSGRLLVTLGIDKKIKLWNLMDMKEAYHKNIWTSLDFIRFAPDGNLLLGYGKEIVLFGVEDNSIIGAVEHEERVTFLEVFDEKYLVSSGKFYFFFKFFLDDIGYVYLREYETRNDMSCIKFRAYEKRVKGFNILKSDDQVFLVTVSTEGFITVWGIEILLEKLKNLQNKIMEISLGGITPIYHFEIDSRIICVASRLNFAKIDQSKIMKKTGLKLGEEIKEAKKRVNRKVKVVKSKLGKLRRIRGAALEK